MTAAYLALGSNLGARAANLSQALRLLEDDRLRTARVSSVYESAPMYFADQPAFLNLVAEVRTTLSPEELLERCHRVERALGRERLMKNGPRTVDVDILLYAKRVVSTPALEIPHPRLAERRFVLEPLAELAPRRTHPVLRRTIADLLGEVMNQRQRRLGGLEEVCGGAA